MFKKFYNRLFLYSFTIGSILGTIIFMLIFGVSILNPKNMDWIINIGGDHGAQFIGWLAYLKSDYFFPIGLHNYLFYPDKYSILYSDHMPFFSFILKPLYYIIGDFQYLGLYVLFNLIMQFSLSLIIIRKFSKNFFIGIIGSTMITLAPILFFVRIFGHTALSSQWVILITLAYILYNYRKKVMYKDMLFWSIMAFITPGIQFYFFPMIFILCVVYCFYKFIITKEVKIFLLIIIVMLITLLSLYIYGAFYGVETSAGGGLGQFNFNLNGFFNPYDFSSLIKSLPINSGQYEGYAYLGVGFIILLIISLGACLSKYKGNSNTESSKENKIFYLFVFLTIILSIITATGGVFYFGKKELFSIELPQIFSTFRSSGRFIWVSVYIIMFFSIYLFSKYINKKYYFIIILIFTIQVYDIFPLIMHFGKNKIESAINKGPISVFTDKECRFFVNNYEYAHILDDNMNGLYPTIYSLLRCNVPINNFYVSRAPENIIDKKKKAVEDIHNNRINNNVLVVSKKLLNGPSLQSYVADETNKVYLYAKNKIDFLTKIIIDGSQIVSNSIDLTNDNFFVYGWTEGEKDLRWSLGNESFIAIPVENRDLTLNIKMYPYLNEKLNEQYVSFFVGEHEISSFKMDNVYTLYKLNIPKEYINNNVLKIKIKLKNKVSSPAEVIKGGDPRYFGVSITNMYIE